MPIFLLPGRGQRAKGPAMERIFQRQQTPLSFVAIVVLGAGKGASQLECALPCFGSAVAEKRLVQAPRSESAVSPDPPGIHGKTDSTRESAGPPAASTSTGSQDVRDPTR